jgi:peptidoglycan/xylan/chitin deacetylase (PgdA/CDA1 family)
MSPRSIGAAIDLEANGHLPWSTILRHLGSRSIIATSLLLGAFSCSDDPSDTPANGGSAGAGQGGSAGNSSGSGGSAGNAAAGSGGSSGAGAGGNSGAAGTANLAGAGGTDADAGGGDAGFPVPDKLVALSFDDGPDATATNLVLDKLEAHGVPASFFLIGQNIGADDAAVLTRAAALGCEFENHSQGYGSLDTADADAINTSINSTNTAIFNATGQNAVFFRPPNLATSALMFSTISMPFAGGLLGNDFPNGSCGAVPSVDCVSNNILNGVQDGTIILLHDVQPLPHPTPAALDIIIPALKQRGFEIVTLRTLFARRSVDPNSQEILWASVPPSN